MFVFVLFSRENGNMIIVFTLLPHYDSVFNNGLMSCSRL